MAILTGSRQAKASKCIPDWRLLYDFADDGMVEMQPVRLGNEAMPPR